MRNYREEFEKRVAYIHAKLAEAHADGIVFGNSGGKDSALVGILCKAACDNTLGVIMPCASSQNYGQDKDDGNTLAAQFGIECRTVDLTAVREAELKALEGAAVLNDRHRGGGEPPRRGHRQPQRDPPRLLHQMGRRGQRFKPHL